jgi:bifunctional non-homologous end joining protein LigD
VPISAASKLDGNDLRRLSTERHKRTLAELARGPNPAVALNEHYVGDGDIVYRHACKLGCEGIVSKRSARPTAPADPSTGSRSRTRRRRGAKR